MQTLKEYYHQRLPHIQPTGSAYFITFRLHGSIHNAIIRELQRDYNRAIDQTMQLYTDNHTTNLKKFNIRKKLIVKYDQILENRQAGPTYLKEEKVAVMCMEQILRYDGQLYELIACTIMSNHVHLLFDTSIQLENENDSSRETIIQIDQIMKKIKGPTAVYANRILKRQGQFWSRESYDIRIRNEKMLANVVSYIIENPVKAGIVNRPIDHQFTYLNPKYGSMC